MRLATSTSIPSPIGGLNDRDSIAAMPATDAVIMENWWPYPSYCGVRKGYTNHVTGFASNVETLVEYLPVSGTSTLFAAAGTAFYDVTSAGAVGAAVQSGLTNARWQHAAITTPGGSFLYLVNGVDKPRLWNGSAWVSVDGVSSTAITGVTTTTLVHVELFKNRLFFVQKDSMYLWYLPVNSIGGAAASLDFGSIFRLGGSITACYTWTVDAGSGSDDHFVVISSMGEVAVYRGTDPSSASTWALVGVFTLGKPLGRRCAVKFGGDLAVITTDGVYPLGRGLLSSSVDRRVALTDKIQNSISVAANEYSANYGWQVVLYPDANMLILNIPPSTGDNYQFAMNVITGSWAKFTGWDANVWLSASSGLYFGDSTAVKKAWDGELDQSIAIQADILPAFSYFGSKGMNKYFTMVRPYILATGSPSILYDINVDYLDVDPAGALATVAPTSMVWNSMAWGSLVWGGGYISLTQWQTIGAIGNSASIRMRVQNNGASVRFDNTDFVFNKGGLL